MISFEKHKRLRKLLLRVKADHGPYKLKMVLGVYRHTGVQRTMDSLLHMDDKDANALLRRAAALLEPKEGSLV